MDDPDDPRCLPGTAGADCQSSFKVVLLGEGAVGKSSLLLRYTEDKFNPQHASTLQAAFATKRLRLESGGASRELELNIWDTAGQEKFHALGPIYYRDSQGAILVYDITDPHSFDRVKSWIRELTRMLGDEVVLMIAGNKSDLDGSRVVERREAEDYAESVSAHFIECSAKENLNVGELFEELSLGGMLNGELSKIIDSYRTLLRDAEES